MTHFSGQQTAAPRPTDAQIRAAHALATLTAHPWSRLTLDAALTANREGGTAALAAALEVALMPERLTSGQRLAPVFNADGQIHQRGQCGGSVEWIINDDGTVTLNVHREPTTEALRNLAAAGNAEHLTLHDALASPRMTVVASITVMANQHPPVYALGDPTLAPLNGRLHALPEHLGHLEACVLALSSLYPASARDAARWLAEQQDTAQQNERSEHAELLCTIIRVQPEPTLLRDAAATFLELAERAEREEAVNAAVEAVFAAAASPHDMIALAEGMLERARLQASVAQRSR